jgi:hypothetical protein
MKCATKYRREAINSDQARLLRPTPRKMRGRGTGKRFAAGLFAILFLTFGNAGIAAAAPPQCSGSQLNPQSRPIPLGVFESNAVITAFRGTGCSVYAGTLGALIADSNGNQYVLGAAHVLALGSTGYLASGSAEAIIQPDLFEVASSCSQMTPALINSIQVASLSTVIQPNFNAHATTPADAALAKVLPGKVSSSILNIPVFSSTPLADVKKGLQVQEQGGCTGLTNGRVITENAYA